MIIFKKSLDHNSLFIHLNFMKIIILDFSDAKVKIINDVPENIENDDYEEYLFKNYNLKISNIEYMIVSELEIETL